MIAYKKKTLKRNFLALIIVNVCRNRPAMNKHNFFYDFFNVTVRSRSHLRYTDCVWSSRLSVRDNFCVCNGRFGRPCRIRRPFNSLHVLSTKGPGRNVPKQPKRISAYVDYAICGEIHTFRPTDVYYPDTYKRFERTVGKCIALMKNGGFRPPLW